MRRLLVLQMVLILAAGIGSAMDLPDAPAYSVQAKEAAYDPENWNLILVNGDHRIPDSYTVDLVRLDNGGAEVDERILPDLQNMFDDMRQEGLDPVVGEGYRTHSDQKKMMSQKILSLQLEGYSRHEAKALAKKWVAEPGTSEHELGIALDINSISGDREYDVYRWLADNAHRYGFILRYPEGKESITGISYEPWHYRYVGVKAAEEIYHTGLTLEEYLGR